MKTCIICRLSKEDFNDEHVIPDSIGGYYHIRSVCTDCNSKLGGKIDNKLTNHLFVEFQRNLLQIKGKSGHIPDPLRGTYSIQGEPGYKVLLEADEDGQLTPRLLPSVSEINAKSLIDGFTIRIDKKDEKDMDKILDKVLKRNGLDRSKITSTITTDEKHPWLYNQVAVDIHDFKMAMLKIAYEFAVDKVPSYFNDASAKTISTILLNADFENLTKKVTFLGSGFDEKVLLPFEHLIDFKNDNHYLMLSSFKGGLLCIINLFSSFSIGILLSSTRYEIEGDVIVGKNDIANRTFETFTMTQLVDATFSPMEYRFAYHFINKEAADAFHELERQPDFDFYYENGRIPFYDEKGNVLYEDIDEKLIQPGVKKTFIGNVKQEHTTDYALNEKVFIKVLPSMMLMPVTTVRTHRKLLTKI